VLDLERNVRSQLARRGETHIVNVGGRAPRCHPQQSPLHKLLSTPEPLVSAPPCHCQPLGLGASCRANGSSGSEEAGVNRPKGPSSALSPQASNQGNCAIGACYAVTHLLQIVTDRKSEKSSIKTRIVTLVMIDGGVSVRCDSGVISSGQPSTSSAVSSALQVSVASVTCPRTLALGTRVRV
jgi:hypothetical protein